MKDLPVYFCASSTASWPASAEARELLPDYHRQADWPLHPVHCQGQGTSWAQVPDSLITLLVLKPYCMFFSH